MKKDKKEVKVSKKEPEHASEVPYVPVNWQHRDDITGRILEILEAVMPPGKQLEATKNLVKESTKRYWITLFNDQFDELTRQSPIVSPDSWAWPTYCQAIWDKCIALRPTKNPYAVTTDSTFNEPVAIVNEVK